MKRPVWMRVAAMCLTVCLCALTLTACNTTEQKTGYTITVQSEGGMPLADVRVNVYDFDDSNKLVWAAMTDENGGVSFEAAPDAKLNAFVSELPVGYEAAAAYPLTGEQTTLKIASHLRKGGIADCTVSLGDMMCDFTVTAGDTSVTSSALAAEYTLSELLKTKKAVVLNFWFENCGPCRAEFPYLENAYKEYADDIEVLAINPYDGTAKSVQTYAANLGLTFPVVKGDDVWASAMNLTAYPTTVVIDRYGMIAMIHKGAVTETGVFEKIFAYFTADDYVQQTVRNLSDPG